MSRLAGTAIIIGALTALLGALTLLFTYSDPVSSPDTNHTVRISAMVVISTTVYLALFELICCLSPVSFGLRRRDHTGYEETSLTDVEYTPRLTMESVLTMVYGLGMVFFVFAYAFTGQQLIVTYVLTVSFSVIGIHDSSTVYPKVFLDILAIVMTSLSSALVLYDATDFIPDREKFVSGDIFVVLSAGVLPLIAPFFLHLVNIQRHKVGIHRLAELCEYGLPFAFILSTVFLLVSDRSTTIMPSQDLWFLLVLSPPLLAPAVLLVTVSVFRENSITPLVAFALVFAGKSLLRMGLSSYLSLLALLAAKLAVLARLASVALPDPPLPAAETPPA